MNIPGYKHYIRINENNEIIKAFSDAFEQPEENDICINDNAERHCSLQIMENNFIYGAKYKYKYIDNEIIEKTFDEMYPKEYRDAAERNMRNEVRKNELKDIDIKSIRSLREWLSSKEDAPKFIKDYESDALAKRNEIE